MNVQVIMRDGEAEYAVVPWAEYQALLAAAGRGAAQIAQPAAAPVSDEPSNWKALREARGLSIELLARAVGISPSYLELIEKGEREASDAIQHGLRRALGSGESGS